MDKIEQHIIEQEKHVTPIEGSVFGEHLKVSIDQLKTYFIGKVLDVGCGDGYGMQLIKDMGFEVEGVDLLPSRVKLATDRGFKVTQAPQEALPFEDKSFDTVFSSHTLEHSFDVDKAISELHRVAKRGILVVPYGETPSMRLESHTSPFETADDLLRRLDGDIKFFALSTATMKQVLVVIDFK